jgi:hypothetical protein
VTQHYLRTSGIQARLMDAGAPTGVSLAPAPEPEVEDPMSKEVANENAAAIASLIGMVPGGKKRVSG